MSRGGVDTLAPVDLNALDRGRLTVCAAEIVAHARELAARGWMPATSGNFSMRLGDELMAVTASGVDKGRLCEADVIAVDLTGRPVVEGRQPSAEVALHAALYRRPGVGAVLHTHSPTQTLAGLLHAAEGRVRLCGYELLKALRGQHTHEATVDVPVVPNAQDTAALAAAADRAIDGSHAWGYLIAGHGMYAWGADLAEARRHLEALDFMLGCELELRRLRA